MENGDWGQFIKLGLCDCPTSRLLSDGLVNNLPFKSSYFDTRNRYGYSRARFVAELTFLASTKFIAMN